MNAIVEEKGLDHYDHIPVRGTKPLAEVYERCNIASLEPNTLAKVAKQGGWMDAMQEEIHMIEKNET